MGRHGPQRLRSSCAGKPAKRTVTSRSRVSGTEACSCKHQPEIDPAQTYTEDQDGQKDKHHASSQWEDVGSRDVRSAYGSGPTRDPIGRSAGDSKKTTPADVNVYIDCSAARGRENGPLSKIRYKSSLSFPTLLRRLLGRMSLFTHADSPSCSSGRSRLFSMP